MLCLFLSDLDCSFIKITTITISSINKPYSFTCDKDFSKLTVTRTFITLGKTWSSSAKEILQNYCASPLAKKLIDINILHEIDKIYSFKNTLH